MDEQDFSALRLRMLEEIAADAQRTGVQTGRPSFSVRVMQAIGKVPRHEFVPLELQRYSYANVPLPIGFEKTISQPFIVGLMTELLDLAATDKVLEIGTGLGYQTAILAELAHTIYTVELIDELAAQARHRLGHRGHRNIVFRHGDGSHGWPEHGPYDKVIVTAAPELIPPALTYQLKAGGRMIIPAGLEDSQQLILVEKDRRGCLTTTETLAVRFSKLDEPDLD